MYRVHMRGPGLGFDYRPKGERSLSAGRRHTRSCHGAHERCGAMQTGWLIVAAALTTCPRATGSNARKGNGVEVSEHQFPAQVRILVEPKSCGGTIISDKWILTAAHCLVNTRGTYIGYGSSDQDKLSMTLAKSTIVHEKFHLFGLTASQAVNDIGLVELWTPLTLDGKLLAAIGLPESDEPLPSKKGLVVGWGKNTWAKVNETRKQRMTDGDIVNCTENTQVICWKSETKSGICIVDSGGPLLMDGKIFGVSSHLMNTDKWKNPRYLCDDSDSWVVFVSVASYREWIRSKTRV